MPTTTRVLIAAGYASVRAGLHALLAAEPDLTLLGDSPTSDALVSVVTDARPEVILLDTSGDGGSSGTGDSVSRGLNALAASVDVNAAVVVVGDDPDRDLPRLARADLPGWGFLLRESADGAQIAGAVRAAAAGLVALDPALSPVFTRDSHIAPPRSGASAVTDLLPGETLTPRESEVLQLMAEGLPNKIIATRLGISLHTAKFHVAQILGKLGAASRTEAVTLGARQGYVTF